MNLQSGDSVEKVTTLRIVLTPTAGGSAAMKNMANTVCYVPCGKFSFKVLLYVSTALIPCFN